MKMHSTQAPRRGRGRQQGFTLVELSVAMLIGLFLLGGLLTLVQDMRRTFGNQNQLGQMQDNERLAMTLITDVIQAAGYYPNPTFYVASTALPAQGAFPSLAPGQGISGTHNAAPPGDTILVQFLTAANDGIINCAGNTNAGAPTVFVNKFSADALGNLNCTVNVLAPVHLISPSGLTATPLSGGVTNLQILYGVKTNFAVANNNADTYLNANQMNANPNNWNNLICVKVTLTFNNSALFKSQPGQPPTINFTRVITVMSRGGANT